MSNDDSVARSLRSPAKLVLVEAPAGCGKTFQGTEYAWYVAAEVGEARVLVLTHTHAACDSFASRTHGAKGHVEIRTIDGFLTGIAAAYHSSLDLPADVGAWAIRRKNGYGEVGERVARLLDASPAVATHLARRYPVVICDEHQDASHVQHAAVMALHRSGSRLRVFGDPMQDLWGTGHDLRETPGMQQWEGLRSIADLVEELQVPHRWNGEARALGAWILDMRENLRQGRPIDLREGSYPFSVNVIFAENESERHGGYRLSGEARRPIDSRVDAARGRLLILSSHNATVQALRAFFNRRFPIWEGHVRESLAEYVTEIEASRGDVLAVASAAVNLLQSLTRGFSPSAFGDCLRDQVNAGAIRPRKGKPEKIRTLARLLLETPDHRGVAQMMRRLSELIESDDDFRPILIDYPAEFWDAVRLGRFDSPSEGAAELARIRGEARRPLPEKAASTIHKSKGLECESVILMPCDKQHFSDKASARCALYVAMSRAREALTFVVSRNAPSPLISF